MKKVISVVGARPNFMKVAPINRALQKYKDKIEHYLVHTGQHYDYLMSDAFLKELEMPEPKYHLGVGSASHAVQTAKIMVEFEKVCLEEKPDLVLVVGDVNSTIACTLAAVKLGIKVAHIEGGLRSFDRDMPEEINRIATDSICNYSFITEESGLRNLKNENFDEKNIFFVGNTMIDSQKYALDAAAKSDISQRYNLNNKEFVLVTLHRPTNVDEPNQLKEILLIFKELAKSRKIVFPVHPRTRKNIELFGLSELVSSISNLLIFDPLGYIDFLSLILKSDFIITDSGGIQEETTVLGIPCLTLRTTTERPSTIDIGSNILVIPEPENIRIAIDDMLNKPRKQGKIPPLWDGNAGERIAEIIAGILL